MRHHAIPILATTALVASAGAADLPRSLSFEIQTATRMFPNGSETGSDNEKEVAYGDLNGDGIPDIAIANGASDFGTKRNKLYFNNGTGTFTEVSGTSVIPEFNNSDVSRNVFIQDYNGDGHNDMYFIGDSNSGGFSGSDKIYIAVFVGGVFSHFEQENDSRIPNDGELGAACGGISADLDCDGSPDVYSGNYPGPSQDRGLYNNGSGFFVDETSSLIPNDGDYTVDIAAGDMNGDGKLDLLISNWSANYIYYNDNGPGSSGCGDYSYSGSTQNIGTASSDENAMETADLDNDGDQDIIWTNQASGNDDRIFRNDGNDGNNEAIFTNLGDILPESTSGESSRKATVADFNDDGRIDVFIASQSGGQPGVLRNTTVEGTISFVDWSPATAFPANANRGWHAAAFDTNGDGDVDIVNGKFSGDDLLENVRANEVNESSLSSGNLPTLWNDEPVAVLGDGEVGNTDVYSVSGVGNGFLSIVLNGPDDYELEIRQNKSVVATIDRGGMGVEEAVQLDTSSGNWQIRVAVLASESCQGDLDGDCSIGTVELLDLLANWGTYDVSDLLDLLAQWGPIESNNEYLLEVLGRDN